MKTKLIIAGAFLLILIARKKKSQESEVAKDTESLEFEDKLNLIRERLHEFLEKNLMYQNDEQIFNTVMNLTDVDLLDLNPDNEISE